MASSSSSSDLALASDSSVEELTPLLKSFIQELTEHRDRAIQVDNHYIAKCENVLRVINDDSDGPDYARYILERLPTMKEERLKKLTPTATTKHYDDNVSEEAKLVKDELGGLKILAASLQRSYRDIRGVSLNMASSSTLPPPPSSSDGASASASSTSSAAAPPTYTPVKRKTGRPKGSLSKAKRDVAAANPPTYFHDARPVIELTAEEIATCGLSLDRGTFTLEYAGYIDLISPESAPDLHHDVFLESVRKAVNNDPVEMKKYYLLRYRDMMAHAPRLFRRSVLVYIKDESNKRYLLTNMMDIEDWIRSGHGDPSSSKRVKVSESDQQSSKW